jgi:hypothetical protein
VLQAPIISNSSSFFAKLISVEEYKYWSSLLFSFFRPPVTAYILGPSALNQ